MRRATWNPQYGDRRNRFVVRLEANVKVRTTTERIIAMCIHHEVNMIVESAVCRFAVCSRCKCCPSGVQNCPCCSLSSSDVSAATKQSVFTVLLSEPMLCTVSRRVSTTAVNLPRVGMVESTFLIMSVPQVALVLLTKKSLEQNIEM